MVEEVNTTITRNQGTDTGSLKLVREHKINAMTKYEQYSDRDALYWPRDVLGTAASWLRNTIVFVNIHGTWRGFVWVSIDEVTLVSFFFTLNESVVDFHETMDILGDLLRPLGGILSFVGDFNAKAVE
ncbi:hypothetical protein J6590_045730 [Homalodisca vitripennis]|nr:hypothetical protein J6590_045730 [Homalodisca vitripennis]